MTITFNETDLLGVVHQLRQLAIYLEGHIPTERDGDKPQHQRSEYLQRHRSFGDAFAARDTRERSKKGGAR